MADETSKTKAAEAPGVRAEMRQQTQRKNPNMKWYIIHTYSGFERKVKESLESRVRAYPDSSIALAGC